MEKFTKLETEDVKAAGDALSDEEKEMSESIKAAVDRPTFFKSRDEYKKKRLEKISKLKEKSHGITMDELESKPGYKEIKTRALVLKDDSIPKKATKDSYI